MEADKLRISMVVESIDIDYQQQLSMFIRLFDYDWSNMGQFMKRDLPVGCCFECGASGSMTSSRSMSVELMLRTGEAEYAGRLHIEKGNEERGLYARGVAVLFNTTRVEDVILLKLAIRIEECGMEFPPIVEVKQLESKHCQTGQIAREDRTTQIDAPTTMEKSCTTEGELFEVKEIEKSVEAVLLREFEQNETVIEKETKELEQPPVPPLEPSKEAVKNKLGHNIVPRLQQLRVLDRMIDSRLRVVRETGPDLRSDVQLKLQKIIKERKRLETIPKTKEQAKKEVRVKHRNVPEAATAEEKEGRQDKKSADDSGTSVGSTSETSSESTSGRSGSSGGETSDSSSSSSSEEEDSSLEESTIEEDQKDKSGSSTSNASSIVLNSVDIKARETTDQLSPTSIYLRDLREKVLRDRLNKVISYFLFVIMWQYSQNT